MVLPHPVPPVLAMNLLDLFMQVDHVGQGISILLGVFSIIAWAVMWNKHRELSTLGRLNHRFEASLRKEASILQQPDAIRHQRAIPYADLFADAVEAYWRAAAIGKEKGDDSPRARLEHAENAIQRALARQTLRYESSMIFLASIVSGAPFMGLFGTVWGVMTAFSAISTQKGGASIADLAPGVTAALFTTIMGLVVAIPSVFGYNYLLGNSKRLVTELENFASSLADRIELESK
jgi:biopolymer transport protein TolQ